MEKEFLYELRLYSQRIGPPTVDFLDHNNHINVGVDGHVLLREDGCGKQGTVEICFVRSKIWWSIRN
jgi:hypothetical protein